MRIDAHQHFWDYQAHGADYVWMDDGCAALRRNFLPPDLAPLLAAAGYDGCVAVQARELAGETAFLLALAAGDNRVRGVVGWLDLCAPDAAAQLDACLAQRGAAALKGMRMLIHDRADPDFADSAPHARGVALLEARGLAYDLLLRPEHLAAALRLVDRLPQQRFVIDHLAKPRADGRLDPRWADGMRAMARRPHVWCKLSGLPTLAPAGPVTPARYAPYLDTVLDAFGAARCMAGSDWPVSTLGASYAGTMGLLEAWATPLSPAERADLFGATATRFYRL